MFGVGRAEVRELGEFFLLSQELCPLEYIVLSGDKGGEGRAASGAFHAGPYIKTLPFSETDTYLNIIWGQHECL